MAALRREDRLDVRLAAAIYRRVVERSCTPLMGSESSLQSPSGAHERVPRLWGICLVAGGGLFHGGIERQDDTDGPAAMRQDVGGSRFPYVPHDARRVRLELAYADHLARSA